ncbi:uncharacterized protein T551_00862 [Pneumocystis jirovecii RU7]|uniref:Uncharacterized protein n=1 Tax=Pneumocystis jirovecii (strain RU7) TaxID=1408657 RepID=A0A0W4ZV01_PNEJ7|nr:uncharacterized protein T551_00862 [Pneumocystis jirovecii RU7]KTW32180.1 hypothetical protein T551_00862 [Pneumocystis jirovecii RU7]
MVYFTWLFVLYLYSKQVVSLALMDILITNKTAKNNLEKKQSFITAKIKEITITMTRWETHHQCITLTAIDHSKININTDDEKSKYETIVGTRDI